MTAQLHVDASDFLRVARLFDRLPRDIQDIAFRRAAGRTRSVVERNYARFAARHIKVAQKLVMARMRSTFSSGDVTLIVRSTNIPLHEIGASERGYGVYVRGRGRYDGAFIPPSSAARAAGFVLKRIGDGRLPTEMLFGPNPANAVGRTPKVYEDLLAEIARGEFATVILQQIGYLLASRA